MSAGTFTRTGAGNNFENQQLVKELHKTVIRKLLKNVKYTLPFKGNIWNVNLANMQLINKYNKGIWFLLCAIDVLVNMYELFLSKTKKALSQVLRQFEQL